jgi:hypothetical protein
MEHQTNPQDLLNKIKELDQATFFCFNESSQKLPVAIIRHLDFENENTLHFDCSYFPLTEKTWDVFAAELHCYKKGMPYSFVLHGVAIISDLSSRRVTFTIQYVESFDPTAEEEGRQNILSMFTKPYKYFFQMSTSLINAFWKKEGDMGVNKAAA